VAAYWCGLASEGIPDRPGLDAGADGLEGVCPGSLGTWSARQTSRRPTG